MVRTGPFVLSVLIVPSGKYQGQKPKTVLTKIFSHFALSQPLLLLKIAPIILKYSQVDCQIIVQTGTTSPDRPSQHLIWARNWTTGPLGTSSPHKRTGPLGALQWRMVKTM